MELELESPVVEDDTTAVPDIKEEPAILVIGNDFADVESSQDSALAPLGFTFSPGAMLLPYYLGVAVRSLSFTFARTDCNEIQL